MDPHPQNPATQGNILTLEEVARLLSVGDAYLSRKTWATLDSAQLKQVILDPKVGIVTFLKKFQKNLFFKNTDEYDSKTILNFQDTVINAIDKVDDELQKIQDEIKSIKQALPPSESEQNPQLNALLEKEKDLYQRAVYFDKTPDYNTAFYNFEAMTSLIILDKLARKGVFETMTASEFIQLINQLKESEFSYAIPSFTRSIGYKKSVQLLVSDPDLSFVERMGYENTITLNIGGCRPENKINLLYIIYSSYVLSQSIDYLGSKEAISLIDDIIHSDYLDKLNSEQMTKLLSLLYTLEHSKFSNTYLEKQISQRLFNSRNEGTELTMLVQGIIRLNPEYQQLAQQKKETSARLQVITHSSQPLTPELQEEKEQLEHELEQINGRSEGLILTILTKLKQFNVFEDASLKELQTQPSTLVKEFSLIEARKINEFIQNMLIPRIKTPEDLQVIIQGNGKNNENMTCILNKISDNTFECTYQDMTKISAEFDMFFQDNPALQALLFSKVINPKGCQQFAATEALEKHYSQRFYKFMECLARLNQVIDAPKQDENPSMRLVKFVCQLFADINKPDELKTTLIELLQVAKPHKNLFFRRNPCNGLIKALSESIYEYEQLGTDGIPSPFTNLSKALGFENDVDVTPERLTDALNQLIKDKTSLPAGDDKTIALKRLHRP